MENPAPAMTAPWLSLLRKLVVVIASIVLLVTLGVYFGLARHERETLVSGKVAAATTVLRYLAVSLAPEVIFGDDKSVTQDLENLAHNDELLSVEVWADEAAGPRLVASTRREWATSLAAPQRGQDLNDLAIISPSNFVVSSAIVDGSGARIGAVRATFSLANVNAAIAASTRRTLWMSLLVALGVVIVLLLAVGQSLLRPMREMRMARELEIAADIQRALLPHKPTHAGFDFAGSMVPADEVGGDFFDVQSSPEALWITVGDVSGHGLPAGLVMLMAQAAFAAHFRAVPDAEPHRVYRAVNELLYDNVAMRLEDDKYVTCQLLTYRGDGSFALVGGHQSLLVYRAATRSVEMLDVPGPWLGIMQTLPEFDTHTLHLDPGDVLCLYSDGIIEARNGRAELYDLPRLKDKVTEALGATGDLDAALKTILDDVLAFCLRPQDDASLLLVRRKLNA
jgi:sigma-B regulation protein RsbU (phosphoserine phosphatase)